MSIFKRTTANLTDDQLQAEADRASAIAAEVERRAQAKRDRETAAAREAADAQNAEKVKELLDRLAARTAEAVEAQAELASGLAAITLAARALARRDDALARCSILREQLYRLGHVTPPLVLDDLQGLGGARDAIVDLAISLGIPTLGPRGTAPDLFAGGHCPPGL